jgi:hypothetical protein
MCAFLEISNLGSYIEDEMPTRPPSYKRCLLNGQCPVMSPTKILNLDLGSLSKYLVKSGLGFFSHILDWQQTVSKLREEQCDLSNHSRTLRLTLKGANGRQGSGLTKAELDPALASASASSFQWIPQCPGMLDYCSMLLYDY